jgi:hypothetical protein
MTLKTILAELDEQIARFKQARSVLNGGSGGRPGRPRAAAAITKPAKKRNVSPEGRERIVEAVKRRWAK